VRANEKMIECGNVNERERAKEKYRWRMIFYRRDLDFVFFAHFADGTTGGFGS